MAEIRTVGLKDRLWHELRTDLAKIAPNLASEDRLICCLCGRLLPIEAFSLEHIIPQQALADDPPFVKQVPALCRSGHTLLCNAPLRQRGKWISQHGCNSWKGSHFDKALRTIFNGTALTRPVKSNAVMIASLVAAYLAIFTKYGYKVVLSEAGLLLRQQFFQPHSFRPKMPVMCQLLLMGQMPEANDASLPMWETPFSFNFDVPDRCSVGIRNYVVTLPISRDPRLPSSTIIEYLPPKYRFRQDFRPLFS